MPIYHLHAKVISRARGQSICAAASYRSGEKIQDERYNQLHDYTKKQGIEHAEILTPSSAPEWTKDRVQLWNAVEAKENRKDSQLAREYELALPHEITQEQRKELVRDFASNELVAKGMITDIALHKPNSKGDSRNYHAHILCTMRTIDSEGFGNKQREWNSKETLENIREQWANYTNRTLEKNNVHERVDHRTLKEQCMEALQKGDMKKAQELDREPTRHKGSLITSLERMGKNIKIRIKEWSMAKAIKNENYEKLQNEMEKYTTEQKQEAYNELLRKREEEIKKIRDEKIEQKEQEESENESASLIDLPEEQIRLQREREAEQEAKLEIAQSEEHKELNDTIEQYGIEIAREEQQEQAQELEQKEQSLNDFQRGTERGLGMDFHGLYLGDNDYYYKQDENGETTEIISTEQYETLQTEVMELKRRQQEQEQDNDLGY